MSYPPPVSAAPNYGQPPRKNRAGLIIALLVILLIGVLGTGGVLAYRLVSDKLHNSSPPTPAAAPASSPTPKRSVPSPQPTKPVRPPTKPPVTTPATTASALGRAFVAQLNANNPKGAAALACKTSKQLIPFLMSQYLKPPTNLTTGTPAGQQPTYVIPLTGTTKGSPVSGVIVLQKLAPAPLCIRAFSAGPN